MNIKKVAKDFIKSGYRFGFGFSDRLAAQLELPEKAARTGGAIFDVAAGGGIVYLAATQMLGIAVGAAAAVAAITTAPVTAVVTVAVGVVFTALNLAMGGIGLGMLDAARVKSGIFRPAFIAARARTAAGGGVKSVFAAAAKLSAVFKKSAGSQKTTAQTPKKPAPAIGNDVIF